MKLEIAGLRQGQKRFRIQLGTLGHLGLFVWSLGMVMISPQAKVPYAAGLCLLLLAAVYPGGWKRAFNARRLVLLGLMAVPPILLLGEVDGRVLGVGISSAGIRASLQIVLRFVVVMVALEGMTNAVEISALAGMLERFGMKGLGFSMGVAMNLLPCLRRSCAQTWQSLRMRGGLRKKWWRGLTLFALTTMTNALARAEEIAQAAEARGFSPDKSRPMPIKKSMVDWVLVPISILSITLLWVI